MIHDWRRTAFVSRLKDNSPMIFTFNPPQAAYSVLLGGVYSASAEAQTTPPSALHICLLQAYLVTVAGKLGFTPSVRRHLTINRC